MYIYKGQFDTQEFQFAEKLAQIFNIDKLENINNDIPMLQRHNDQNTEYHYKFYYWMETSEFLSIYKNFIKKYIRPLYNDKIIVQKKPTFRICYPNNIAVGEFHKDKWYRDNEWAIRVKELNFFVPFTESYDTNTIWVESEEDKKDFLPMNCSYGEFIQWDGSNLTHGNKINDTGKTRVSIDFRVIEYENYIPSDHGSINLKKKFRLGEYYELYV